MRKNHKTTTVLVAMAVIAATLLAAGTVAAVGNNHSAFAHKEYQKKYEKYTKEDKSGRDGDNINVNKQVVICINGHEDGVKKPGGVKTTAEPTDETGSENECHADNTNTNNDGSQPTYTGPPGGAPPGGAPPHGGPK